MPAPYAKTFVGVACRKCGGTERYFGCRNCVACARMASRRQGRVPQGALARWLSAPVCTETTE